MIEMKVVIINFLNNCGLLGAPGSLPLKSLDLLLSVLIFMGRAIKSMSHHITKNIIIDPVRPKLNFF